MFLTGVYHKLQQAKKKLKRYRNKAKIKLYVTYF